MANDLTAFDKFIYGRLSGDSAVKSAVGSNEITGATQVYDNEAPGEGTSNPYIFFRYRDGEYRNSAEGRRYLARANYTIVAVWEGQPDQVSFSDLEDLADDMETALLTDQLDRSDPTVLGCTVVQPYKSDSTRNGIRTLMLGGIFSMDRG